MTEEEFQRECKEYRAMRHSVEGKSHQEQLDAINKFRCGEWKHQ